MAIVSPHSLASLAQRFASRLQGPLRKIGLTVHLFDPCGTPLAEPTGEDEFCGRICQRTHYCRQAMVNLAQRVCLDERSSMDDSPCGCCMMGVPVRRRRKLIGSAVGCFASDTTPDSEELHRACSQQQLDYTFMRDLCRPIVRHNRSEANTLLQVMEWVLENDQARDVAGEELATLSSNLSSTYEELSLVYRISSSMKVTQTPSRFFETLCRELLEVMQLETAAVLLEGRPELGIARQSITAGTLLEPEDKFTHVIRTHLSGRVLTSGQPMIDNDFASSGGQGAGIERIIAVPLVSADHCNGMVVGANKTTGDFDSTDLKLISSISSQANVFLENHHLYQDQQALLMGLLHALTASIDAKDPYTSGHSQRVAAISRKLAEMSTLDPKHVERVYLAGLLHDVGKIGMPESVLCKPGKLTDEEFAKIREHPLIGARILGGIRQMADIIPAVLGHHERLDGRGYPHGLAGNQIGLEARIVGLADGFDAMTSNRTYRAALPLKTVTDEIRRCCGTQFDAQLVGYMLSLDLESFLGQLRELSEHGVTA